MRRHHHLLIGTQGEDYLANTDGPALMLGLRGDDTLTEYAREHSPSIMIGGGGADIFVFDNNFSGLDTIVDYQPGIDRIGLPQDDSADLLLSQHGNNVLIELAVGHVVLLDTNVSELHYYDFILY